MKTWNYSDEIPMAVSVTKHLGVKVFEINYGLELNPETSGDSMNQKYRYSSVRLAPGVNDYRSIVSAMVNNEYDRDAMQAIINNYLLDPEDSEASDEFTNMQKFRADAKRIAHDFIDGVIDQNTSLQLPEASE